MKKSYLLCLALLLLLILPSCAGETTEPTTSSETTAATEAQTTTSVTEETTSAAITTEATTTEATTAEDETTHETTAVATETTTSGPVNTAEMYSSYAFLVSYDPATGWAEFDYFDMLIGEDAVQWLVDHEGYDLADAQELVDNFADSEFVLKNINPRLRTVDLTDLPLRLMYKPDGSMISMPDEWPFDTDITGFNAIYAIDPDLLLDSFFFYIEVDAGMVTSVEQVYWP